MKRYLNFILLIIGISYLSTIKVDAATLTINGDSKESTSSYEIKYNPEESPVDTLNLEVSAVNPNLQYSISSDYGTCDNNLKCTLVTTTLTTESTIATLTVTNLTADKQKDNIVLSGTISGASKSIELNPGAVTTTTTTVQRVLNSEAVLSGINLSVGTMDQAFASDIMEYNITGVKDTVNSLTITPNCDNNCNWSITCPTGGCSVSNTRRVALQDGANKVAINVTSEDGSANKTYIFNIYRGEVVTSSAYLSELKINDGTISPNFDSMTNDYSITVGLDVEKLDIITTTEDPSAEVVIKGNDKLLEGENTVTITVTSSDGENKQVYTIVVNKEAIEDDVVEEEKVPTTKVEKKKNNTWLIILLSVLGLALIVVVFLIIFKKKKNNKNNKNDKNNNNKSSGGNIEEKKENTIEEDNTESLNILNETRNNMHNEPKQNIDDALDDLMQTKRLELGDLDF